MDVVTSITDVAGEAFAVGALAAALLYARSRTSGVAGPVRLYRGVASPSLFCHSRNTHNSVPDLAPSPNTHARLPVSRHHAHTLPSITTVRPVPAVQRLRFTGMRPVLRLRLARTARLRQHGRPSASPALPALRYGGQARLQRLRWERRADRRGGGCPGGEGEEPGRSGRGRAATTTAAAEGWEEEGRVNDGQRDWMDGPRACDGRLAVRADSFVRPAARAAECACGAGHTLTPSFFSQRRAAAHQHSNTMLIDKPVWVTHGGALGSFLRVAHFFLEASARGVMGRATTE